MKQLFAKPSFFRRNAKFLDAVGKLNLVTVKSKSALFKGKNLYKTTTVIFAACAILLLIAVSVISACYANSRKQLHYTEGVCTSEECLRSAADLHRSIDLTADPCEDFYQYSCGRWDQVYVNQGWHSSFSMMQVIEDHMYIVVQKFLELSPDPKEPLPVQQARLLYRSCLNEGASNKLGYTTVHKYLAEAGLPVVPTFFKPEEEKVDYSFDWIKVAASVRKTFTISLFVHFRLVLNIYNNTYSDFYVIPGSTELRLPSQFVKNKYVLKNILGKTSSAKTSGVLNTMKQQDKEYFKVVIANATKAPDAAKVEEAVNIVWNVTRDLWEITDFEDQTEELSYTVDELQNVTNNCLRDLGIEPFEYYKPYLDYLFEDIDDASFEEDDLLYVSDDDAEAVCKILAYITRTPDEVLELYAWWLAMRGMIRSTTTEMRDFGKEDDDDPTRLVSRSRDCAGITLDYMPLAISYGVIDKGVTSTITPKVKEMIEEIKAAFVGTVRTLDWMDQETKDAAITKANNMVSFIGFPDWLFNETALESFYNNITITEVSFLDNLMQFVKSKVPRKLSTYKTANLKEMRAPPTEANAYHYPSENSIHLPMAILTFPMYNLGLEALNYGAFGNVLGHELTHGFDNDGRYYDKDGNNFNWWTNQTDTIFEEKAQCFVEQYNDFYVESIDKHVNGTITLGENLADNGGLNNIYKAYRNHTAKYGKGQYLPGFEDFTDDQMFFIAFASSWCVSTTDEELSDLIDSDEHSPDRFRLIGSLQNSEDFARSFNCPKGSGMNPKRKKCKIW